MELTYHRDGDYLFPDMGLSEQEQVPVGKYGLMRQSYLEEHRPGLYAQLTLSGRLMEHLHEIDRTSHERLEVMITAMMRTEGATEALKAADQKEWVRRMNHIRYRAEEILLAELIYA